MRQISAVENMDVIECLASKSRIEILKILGTQGPQNIKTLSSYLDISSAVVAKHVVALENAGLITAELIPGKRGTQKVCKLVSSEITISFVPPAPKDRGITCYIPIGQYIGSDVTPTCGMVSVNKVIGYRDDPRYFSSPEHVDASLLWFTSGWVEYRIPCYIIPPQPVTLFQIKLELCSEYPDYREDWPSDIHFYLNDILLGVWTSPGDFGGKKGIYTPSWWTGGSEYGYQKVIQITDKGTMLDGMPLSDVVLADLDLKSNKDMHLRIAVPSTAKNVGGVNIFGKGFGNYGQDIEIYVEYD